MEDENNIIEKRMDISRTLDKVIKILFYTAIVLLCVVLVSKLIEAFK